MRTALILAGSLLLAGLSVAPAREAGGATQPRRQAGPEAAGGIAMLLQANREDFARSRLAMMEDRIRRVMRTGRIEIGETPAGDGQFSFRVGNPAQIDRALQSARAESQGDGPAATGGWDVLIAAGNMIVVRETQASLDGAVDRAMDAARDVIARRVDSLGARGATVVRQGTNRILVRVAGVRDPAALRALIEPTARLEFRLVDADVTPEQLAAGQAPIGSQILPYRDDGLESRIAVERRAIITGDMISGARQALDSYDGSPVVAVTFNDDGRRRLARATQENVGKRFAIILDDVILCVPFIQSPILGGVAEIHGSFTVESAGRLATWLRSGALPIGLVTIGEETPALREPRP